MFNTDVATRALVLMVALGAPACGANFDDEDAQEWEQLSQDIQGGNAISSGHGP